MQHILFTTLAAQFGFAAHASVPMHTKDIKGVTMGCKGGEFIVSLNDDDDNGDKKQDLTAAKPSAAEDNLRPITLAIEGAKYVTLNPPTNPKRIRAYHSDKVTPLSFQKSYPVPLNFYVEGITPSKPMRDFSFSYTFIGEKGEEVCDAKAEGTVVNVAATFQADGQDRIRFDKTRKLLATGKGVGKGLWKPLKKPVIKWAYEGTATFKPRRKPKDITFVAGTTLTGATNLNGDDVTALVSYKKQVILAHTPVNITAPIHAEAYEGWTDGSNADTPIFDANKGYVGLFKRYVKYRLLDQFNQPIITSARGGKKIQVKENIRSALTSPLPRIATWIRRKLKATDNWKTKNDGEIHDQLRVQFMPKNTLLRVAGRFNNNVQRNGAPIMNLGTNTHQWITSISGNRATEAIVTRNTFTVVVTRYNPRYKPSRNEPPRPAMILRSNYGVVVQ